MRPLILNEASLRAPNATRHEISSWLRDLAIGIRGVVTDGIAERKIRMRPQALVVKCTPSLSFHSAILNLRGAENRDTRSYWLGLTTKAPWIDDLPEAKRERFLSCEECDLPKRDGEALLLCVVTGGIAVGFPSSPLWDTDRMTIRFIEMISEDKIEEEAEDIDSLARLAHAAVIAERHRAALRSCADAGELWRRLCEVFPHLRFGPGVEANLSRLGGHLPGVAEKLAGLDAAAAEWKDAGGDTPRWRTKVTRESESLRKNPELLDRRRFRSRTGRRELFEWHARYGSGGRIHLRLERESKEIEIGYIGPHLPL